MQADVLRSGRSIGRIFCKFAKQSTEDRKGDMQSLKLDRNHPQESLCAGDKPWENEGLCSDCQAIHGMQSNCSRCLQADTSFHDVCFPSNCLTQYLTISWVSGIKTVLQLQYCFRPASLFCLTLSHMTGPAVYCSSTEETCAFVKMRVNTVLIKDSETLVCITWPLQSCQQS